MAILYPKQPLMRAKAPKECGVPQNTEKIFCAHGLDRVAQFYLKYRVQ